AAALLTFACAGSGAHTGSSAAPACHDAGCNRADACVGDGGCASDAVCASGLQPTFQSIRSKVFNVSCGTGGSICHSSAGGTDSGQLNLADDPYAALLGPDGMGARASNIAGSVRNLTRV